VSLAVRPPLPPMLAKLTHDLPRERHLYEPKWDGFRCLAFRDGDDIDLRSRHDRPFSRYFPEIVESLRSIAEPAFAFDGEVVLVRQGRFDFEALMLRLHPAASRVQRLSAETPATFVAFDVLAVGDEDLLAVPFAKRRTQLERLLRIEPPHVRLTPITDDPDVAAAWVERFEGGGVDGVIAKSTTLRYEPGRRSMVKVKTRRTADCVLAGYRPFVDRPIVSSLLLGLYDGDGVLLHVGVVQAFTDRRREELIHELEPLRIPLGEHPWADGFEIGGGPLGRLLGAAGRWTPEMEHDWVPLRPERVVEVAFDQVDGVRLRHPARFVRWRPDRDPASCTVDQLVSAATDVAELLASA
jgi:ATP-dependent DNA ligase